MPPGGFASTRTTPVAGVALVWTCLFVQISLVSDVSEQVVLQVYVVYNTVYNYSIAADIGRFDTNRASSWDTGPYMFRNARLRTDSTVRVRCGQVLTASLVSTDIRIISSWSLTLTAVTGRRWEGEAIISSHAFCTVYETARGSCWEANNDNHRRKCCR